MPPHERPWRHPSELPAPAHEPPTRGGRLLIVVTAAVGLVLVGVTRRAHDAGPDLPAKPWRRSRPRRCSATSAPTRSAGSPVRRRNRPRGHRHVRPDAVLAGVGGEPPPRQRHDDSGRRRRRADAAVAIVTPIGSDGLGVTTAAAVAGRSGAIEAMLPSGTSSRRAGRYRQRRRRRALHRGRRQRRRLARPRSPPTSGRWSPSARTPCQQRRAAGPVVPEASPVFDSSGALVGLCTIGPDGVAMLPVDSLPDVEPPLVVATDATDRADDRAGTELPRRSRVSSDAPAESPGPALRRAPGEPPATACPRHDRAGGRRQPTPAATSDSASVGDAADAAASLGRQPARVQPPATATPPRTPSKAATAAARAPATIPPRDSSWRRCGVIIVHHLASVPST